MAEHCLCKAGVRGSIPLGSTIKPQIDSDLRLVSFGDGFGSSSVGFMKFVLTIVAIAAVAFGISKLRQRNDADLWHEVTTR